MACLARALSGDPTRPSRPVGGAQHLPARAANDNAPDGNLTTTTEGAAMVGSNPGLNLTTTVTPDTWGNVAATKTPLCYWSYATFDLDRRPIFAIAPVLSGTSVATRNVYDANGRLFRADKATATDLSGGFA